MGEGEGYFFKRLYDSGELFLLLLERIRRFYTVFTEYRNTKATLLNKIRDGVPFADTGIIVFLYIIDLSIILEHKTHVFLVKSPKIPPPVFSQIPQD